MSQPSLVQRDAFPSVLLVDAAIDEREMYAIALEQQGYAIRQATTTAEALQEIRSERPDVIVADVCLPIVGGLDLLRILRHDQDTSDIPVIILSGYAGTLGELTRATELGANGVRTKPLAPESLGNDIASVIEKSRKLREVSADMRMRSAELRQRAEGAIGRADGAIARAVRVINRAPRLSPSRKKKRSRTDY